jgi:hypothetical protein
MMQTDVKAAHTETTDTLVQGRNRLKGYQILGGGTAGDIIFRDGGSGGVNRLQLNISASTNYPFYALIPGEGILFETDIHVTIPNLAKVTIFYG